MNNCQRIFLAFLVVFAGIIAPLSVKSAIRLPALIGNNMVLQQNATIRVWGWADAGEKVVIQASWQNAPVITTTPATGTWSTTLNTPKAGGPYKMTITGNDYSIIIGNIMIGEVWVCSGQSNMEFTMRGLGGWKNYNPEVRNEVASGKYADVRLFTVGRDTSAVPLANCKGSWRTADTNTVNDFSATAWFYGAYLNEKLGVPVGLISTAWGGTPAEVWTPVESIKAEPDLGFYLDHYNGSQWWPGTPGVLFNAMIHPLLNYTIKGAIWYQGESNILDARLYPALMKTMITSWRNAWGLGDFPFYFVQIAPFAYEEPYAGALLREAQLKCLSVPNTGMAVTMDLVDNINDIHPKNKLDVGKRLALWALDKTYGKSGESFSGPVYTDMKISGNELILSFQYAERALKLVSNANNNFTIAGADRVFYPATVKVMGEKLVLYSRKVNKPVAARYAFTNTSQATFFNASGLPAPSFRTDNWDLITSDVVLQPQFDTQAHQMMYKLTVNARETDIYYDFNKVPTKNAPRFLSPIPAGKTGTLYAVPARDGYISTNISSWKLGSNKALGAIIKPEGNDKTSSQNLVALVDGVLGNSGRRDASWMGLEGNDLDIVLDLATLQPVKNIKCNFLSENNAWVFLPRLVQVEVSDDGITYRKVGESSFSADKEVKGFIVRPLAFAVNGKARFVKLVARNQGVCPAWHPGAGYKCWLFLDEIVVE